jgi:hypothetical protein
MPYGGEVHDKDKGTIKASAEVGTPSERFSKLKLQVLYSWRSFPDESM